jgi:hypothetical protein
MYALGLRETKFSQQSVPQTHAVYQAHQASKEEGKITTIQRNMISYFGY